jgi:dual specificity tyrosine-phosphorylation-regulated kinase 2/3/4
MIKGELKIKASHNKSSNIASSILGKSELLEDRITQVSQTRKYERVSSLSHESASSSKAAGGLSTKPKKTWPMKPSYVLNSYRDVLTEYEKTEILEYKEIYFVGPNAKKIRGLPCQDEESDFHYKEIGNNNNRYDDEKGDYKVVEGDHIAYRYEVKEKLGKGSFGQVFKCWDHKEKEYVALKIIRNKKKLQFQAKVEVNVLRHLRSRDPDDTHNVIKMKDSVMFRNHLCVGFELLNINLYEFIKLTDFEGLSVGLIRRFAIQILYALNFFKQEKVIHCDLKPENILLKNKYKSGIKVIDLGSACFINTKVYTYIQSRFYRAPEIILGVPYTYAIDMWSLGCILAELYTGLPIFQGEDEKDQIGYIMEILDVPPISLLAKGARSHLFFEKDGTPIITPNSHGKRRYPCTKDIQQVMECDDSLFMNFITR